MIIRKDKSDKSMLYLNTLNDSLFFYRIEQTKYMFSMVKPSVSFAS